MAELCEMCKENEAKNVCEECGKKLKRHDFDF